MSATVNVSEEDFGAVAWAANKASSLGRTADAKALDKLARKINAALSANNIQIKTAGPGVREIQTFLERCPKFDN